FLQSTPSPDSKILRMGKPAKIAERADLMPPIDDAPTVRESVAEEKVARGALATARNARTKLRQALKAAKSTTQRLDLEQQVAAADRDVAQAEGALTTARDAADAARAAERRARAPLYREQG